MAAGCIPAHFIKASHKTVRPLLKKAQPLRRFLARTRLFTPKQRRQIVDQAIMLLEGFYVHLPLKRAMYAVDPVRRLRLLRYRLPRLKNDRLFNAEMTDIFMSLRDLHTDYLLPVPFA